MAENIGEHNTNPAENPDGPRVIPVIEERVIVDKKWVETGKVVISKTVAEDLTNLSISCEEEEVHVERVPWNIYVDTPPPSIRYEGDVMVVSVLKEVAVVEKKMMLVEELRVTRVKKEKIETQEIMLRKEEVTITRTDL